MAQINWNFLSNILKSKGISEENIDMQQLQNDVDVDIASEISAHDYSQDNDFHTNMMEGRKTAKPVITAQTSMPEIQNTIDMAGIEAAYTAADAGVQSAQGEVDKAQEAYDKVAGDDENKKKLDQLTEAEANEAKCTEQLQTTKNNIIQSTGQINTLTGNIKAVDVSIRSLNASITSESTDEQKAEVSSKIQELTTQKLQLEAQLNQEKAKLEVLKDQYKMQEQQLKMAKSLVEKLKSEVKTDNRPEVEEARQKLSQAKQNLEKAKVKKEDAKAKLDEAKAADAKQKEEIKKAEEEEKAQEQEELQEQEEVQNDPVEDEQKQAEKAKEQEKVQEDKKETIAEKAIDRMVDDYKDDSKRIADNPNVLENLGDFRATAYDMAKQPAEFVQDMGENIIDNTRTGQDNIDGIVADGAGQALKGGANILNGSADLLGSITSSEDGSTTEALDRIWDGTKQVGKGTLNAATFGIFNDKFGSGESSTDSLASKSFDRASDETKKDFGKVIDDVKDTNISKAAIETAGATLKLANQPFKYVEDLGGNIIDNTKTDIKPIDNIVSDGAGKALKGGAGILTGTVDTVGSALTFDGDGIKESADKVWEGTKDVGKGAWNAASTLVGNGWLWRTDDNKTQESTNNTSISSLDTEHKDQSGIESETVSLEASTEKAKSQDVSSEQKIPDFMHMSTEEIQEYAKNNGIDMSELGIPADKLNQANPQSVDSLAGQLETKQAATSKLQEINKKLQDTSLSTEERNKLTQEAQDIFSANKGIVDDLPKGVVNNSDAVMAGMSSDENQQAVDFVMSGKSIDSPDFQKLSPKTQEYIKTLTADAQKNAKTENAKDEAEESKNNQKPSETEVNQRKYELEVLRKKAGSTLSAKNSELEEKYGHATFAGQFFHSDATLQSDAAHLEAGQNENMSQFKEFSRQAAQLAKNADTMSPEEYKKSFEAITGMELESYRASKELQEKNVDFSYAANNAATQKLQTEEGKEAQKAAMKKIQSELNKAELADYGYWKTAIDSTMETLDLGTSREDIANKYNEKADQFIELLKTSKDNPEEFAAKYQEMTGVTFDPAKIQKAQSETQEYQEAKAYKAGTQQVCDALEKGADFVSDANRSFVGSETYAVQHFDELKDTTLKTASVLSGQKPEDVEAELEKQYEAINNKKFADATKSEQAQAYMNVLKSYTTEEKVAKAKELNEEAQILLNAKESSFKVATEEAYGKNEISEMMEKNQAQVEGTYQGVKVAAIIGASIATGGAGAGLMGVTAASGLASMTIDTMEKAIDNDGLTMDESKQICKDGLTTAMFTALGGGANAVNGLVTKNVAKVTTSKVIQRVAGEGAELVTDATTSFAANMALGNETTWNAEAMQSGLPQLGFMAAGSLGSRAKGAFKAADSINTPKIELPDTPKIGPTIENASKVDAPYIDSNGNKIYVHNAGETPAGVTKTSNASDTEVKSLKAEAKARAKKAAAELGEAKSRAESRDLERLDEYKKEMKTQEVADEKFAQESADVVEKAKEKAVRIAEAKKLLNESQDLLKGAGVDTDNCKFQVDKDNNVIIRNMFGDEATTGKLTVNPDGTKTLTSRTMDLDDAIIDVEYYPSGAQKTFKRTEIDGSVKIENYNENGTKVGYSSEPYIKPQEEVKTAKAEKTSETKPQAEAKTTKTDNSQTTTSTIDAKKATNATLKMSEAVDKIPGVKNAKAEVAKTNMDKSIEEVFIDELRLTGNKNIKFDNRADGNSIAYTRNFYGKKEIIGNIETKNGTTTIKLYDEKGNLKKEIREWSHGDEVTRVEEHFSDNSKGSVLCQKKYSTGSIEAEYTDYTTGISVRHTHAKSGAETLTIKKDDICISNCEYDKNHNVIYEATKSSDGKYDITIGLKDNGNYQFSSPDAMPSQLRRFSLLSSDHLKQLKESGFFEVMATGKMDASVINNLGNNKYTFASDRTLAEIKKISTGDPVVKTVSSLDDIKTIPSGDVAEINGKLYVNNNGKAVELSLSKEKFEELFPRLTSMDQSGAFEMVSDCYLISRLDAYMEKAKGKTTIYSMFKQDGDDIIVKLPNQEPIRFKSGKVVDVGASQIQGNQTGLKMIEQAYAANCLNKAQDVKKVLEISSSLEDPFELMHILDAGGSKWSKDIFEDIQSVNAKNFKVDSPDNFEKVLEKVSDENLAMVCNTRIAQNANRDIAEDIRRKYRLNGGSGHANAIKGYDKATKTVYITDPMHSSDVIAMSLEDFKQVVSKIYVMHIE